MLNRKALFGIVIAHLLTLSFLITEFFFMRYLHYHSQYQHLRPDDYNVQVLLPADYEKLSNPDVRQVTLSDGTVRTLTDNWYKSTLPNYKAAENGQYYVLTTIKGTAPFFTRWLMDFVFISMFSIGGLVWGIRLLAPNRPTPEQSCLL